MTRQMLLVFALLRHGDKSASVQRSRGGQFFYQAAAARQRTQKRHSHLSVQLFLEPFFSLFVNKLVTDRCFSNH